MLVLPAVVAHRGGYRYSGYPQNSLAALKAAIALAMQHPNVAFWVEADVWRCQSGELILFHNRKVKGDLVVKDAAWQRLKGKKITQCTWDDLQQLRLKPLKAPAERVSLDALAQPYAYLRLNPETDDRIPQLGDLLDLLDRANADRAQEGEAPIGCGLDLKSQRSQTARHVARGQWAAGRNKTALFSRKGVDPLITALVDFLPQRAWQTPLIIMAQWAVMQHQAGQLWEALKEKPATWWLQVSSPVLELKFSALVKLLGCEPDILGIDHRRRERMERWFMKVVSQVWGRVAPHRRRPEERATLPINVWPLNDAARIEAVLAASGGSALITSECPDIAIAQAEAVSYVVSRYLGIENPFSRDYTNSVNR